MLSWLHCHYLFTGLGELIIVCWNVTGTCFLNHTCLYLLWNAGSLMEKGHKLLSSLTFWHLVIYRAAHCTVRYPPGHSRVRLIPIAYFGCMTMTPSQKMIQKIYLTLLAIWTSTQMETPSIHIQTKACCCWETGTGTRGQWSWESVSGAFSRLWAAQISDQKIFKIPSGPKLTMSSELWEHQMNSHPCQKTQWNGYITMLGGKHSCNNFHAFPPLFCKAWPSSLFGP